MLAGRGRHVHGRPARRPVLRAARARRLTDRGAGALVGTGLLAFGLGVALWARSQPVTRCTAPRRSPCSARCVLAATNAWARRGPRRSAPRSSSRCWPLAVLVLAAAPPGGRRLAGLAGAVSWLVLPGAGVGARWRRRRRQWWAERAAGRSSWPRCRGRGRSSAPRGRAPRRPPPASPSLPLVAARQLARRAGPAPTTDAAGPRHPRRRWPASRSRPEPWARGAAVLAALGAVVLGAAAPGGRLLRPRRPSRTARRRAGDTPLRATQRPRGALDPAVLALAVACALVGLLRVAGVRRPVAAPRRGAGRAGPRVRRRRWSAPRSPLLWAGVLAAALAAAVAAGRHVARARRSTARRGGAPPPAYFVLGTLAAAPAVAGADRCWPATASRSPWRWAFALRERERARVGRCRARAPGRGARRRRYAVDGVGARARAADDGARALAAAARRCVGLLAAAGHPRRVSRVALEAAAVAADLRRSASPPTTPWRRWC